MDEMGPIYKEFRWLLNCQILISAASPAGLPVRPNTEGAQLAGALLTQIDPGSVCCGDALSNSSQKRKRINWQGLVLIEKVFENQVMLWVTSNKSMEMWVLPGVKISNLPIMISFWF